MVAAIAESHKLLSLFKTCLAPIPHTYAYTITTIKTILIYTDEKLYPIHASKQITLLSGWKVLQET